MIFRCISYDIFVFNVSIMPNKHIMQNYSTENIVNSRFCTSELLGLNC
jgi:hypothetical protein